MRNLVDTRQSFLQGVQVAQWIDYNNHNNKKTSTVKNGSFYVYGEITSVTGKSFFPAAWVFGPSGI